MHPVLTIMFKNFLRTLESEVLKIFNSIQPSHSLTAWIRDLTLVSLSNKYIQRIFLICEILFHVYFCSVLQGMGKVFVIWMQVIQSFTLRSFCFQTPESQVKTYKVFQSVYCSENHL